MANEKTYVTRWVITHRAGDGYRQLATAQQGRCTFETREQAETRIKAMMENNSIETLKSLYALPLKAMPCECYPGHFDPKQCYFESEE